MRYKNTEQRNVQDNKRAKLLTFERTCRDEEEKDFRINLKLGSCWYLSWTGN